MAGKSLRLFFHKIATYVFQRAGGVRSKLGTVCANAWLSSKDTDT